MDDPLGVQERDGAKKLMQEGLDFRESEVDFSCCQKRLDVVLDKFEDDEDPEGHDRKKVSSPQEVEGAASSLPVLTVSTSPPQRPL